MGDDLVLETDLAESDEVAVSGVSWPSGRTAGPTRCADEPAGEAVALRRCVRSGLLTERSDDPAGERSRR